MINNVKYVDQSTLRNWFKHFSSFEIGLLQINNNFIDFFSISEVFFINLQANHVQEMNR